MINLEKLIDKKPFIIAEVSANHKQDLKIAKKLIDLASEAGANAIIKGFLSISFSRFIIFI